MSRPEINVTPLIDVLLVLLIIFMVITPLKPSGFKARVPAEPDNTPPTKENPFTLLVAINREGSLSLNREVSIATVNEPTALAERLQAVFRERIANGSVRSNNALDAERPYSDVIERTVFIKAPKTLAYGDVARVVDTVKLSGAYPVSLQIDDLE